MAARVTPAVPFPSTQNFASGGLVSKMASDNHMPIKDTKHVARNQREIITQTSWKSSCLAWCKTPSVVLPITDISSTHCRNCAPCHECATALEVDPVVRTPEPELHSICIVAIALHGRPIGDAGLAVAPAMICCDDGPARAYSIRAAANLEGEHGDLPSHEDRHNNRGAESSTVRTCLIRVSSQNCCCTGISESER